jgi:phage shock protein E
MKSFRILLLLVFAVLASKVFGGDTGSSVIIDVRTETEWKEGHLEGALLIPHEQIGQEIAKKIGDKKTRIYLYCRSGRRTGIAFDVLKKAGYEISLISEPWRTQPGN